MDSTPRQIHLQRLLGYRTPEYLHIPVITHPDGDKLSKLTGAPGIPLGQPGPVLVAALSALQQEPPGELARAGLPEIWTWAGENWRTKPLIGMTAVSIETIAGDALTDHPFLP